MILLCRWRGIRKFIQRRWTGKNRRPRGDNEEEKCGCERQAALTEFVLLNERGQ